MYQKSIQNVLETTKQKKDKKIAQKDVGLTALIFDKLITTLAKLSGFFTNVKTAKKFSSALDFSPTKLRKTSLPTLLRCVCYQLFSWPKESRFAVHFAAIKFPLQPK